MQIRLIALVAVLAMACSSLNAADGKPGKKKGNASAKTPFALTLPAEIKLSAEQQKQVDSIREKYTSDATALQKQIQELIPEDVRKAQAAAMKEAKESGKTPQEIRKISSELQSDLDAGTQEKIAELRKQTQELKSKFIAEVRPVLTEDQLAHLPKQACKGTAKPKKKKDA